jgi:hypothetical protein
MMILCPHARDGRDGRAGAQERCDFADDYARLRLRLQVLGVQLTTQRLAVRPSSY